MNNPPKVLVIDDDEVAHELIAEALAGSCELQSVMSGEEALALLGSERPDLILVDVAMPGIDGYEACRQIKAMDDFSDVPVMFISGHDSIRDRLCSYEAGGADFITKPFNLKELKAKVDYLLSMCNRTIQIREMADFASRTAMTAMSSMSELGSLLEVLKNFNSREDFDGLASNVIEGLRAFGLQGVVQIVTPQGKTLRSDRGTATPLEASVIEHTLTMGRIASFRTRLSIHYDRVAVLVNNMPTYDPELCGRLRDHLAILVDAADARAKSIVAAQQSNRRGQAIEKAMRQSSDALRDIDVNQRTNQINVRTAFEEMIGHVDRALLEVALTEAEEIHLMKIVRNGAENVINIHAGEADIQNRLSKIVNELKELVA
jgi:CheY-like chemotaxis protein